MKQLQHRGRESFGIGYLCNNKIIVNKYLGLVENKKINNILNISSRIWCDHVRYSTSGKKMNANNINSVNSFKNKILPLQISFFEKNDSTMLYNGNIHLIIWNKIFIAFPKLKEYYLKEKDISDSFLILKFIKILKYHISKENNLSKENIILEILKIFLELIERCFCLVLIFNNHTYIIRDKYEVRPLCLALNKKKFFNYI